MSSSRRGARFRFGAHHRHEQTKHVAAGSFAFVQQPARHSNGVHTTLTVQSLREIQRSLDERLSAVECRSSRPALYKRRASTRWASGGLSLRRRSQPGSNESSRPADRIAPGPRQWLTFAKPLASSWFAGRNDERIVAGLEAIEVERGDRECRRPAPSVDFNNA